jgi:dTDP-4-dehydrorhamnose 3,5-epimerase
MLPGIKVQELKEELDESGMLCELLNKDWKELMEGDEMVQANMSSSYPGIIRAWHRHARGQVDYFVVLRGLVRICAYDDRPDSKTRGELTEIVSSEKKPQIVRIPGFYWHGTKTLGNDSSLIVYFTNRLYDSQNPDEERRPWNDPNIIDPRCGKPYDWNSPPHR